MGLPNENGTGMYMPIMPAYGNGNNDGFGNDGWWPLLFLFALWGNNGNGFFGNGNGSNGSVFPYFTAQNTDAQVRAGFDTAAITGQLSAIQAGQSAAEVAACGRALDQVKATYDSEIAGMNQRFTDALNLQGNLNTINNSLQSCCCENRANIADLKYTVATEACADRAAVTDALTTALNTINGGIQSIKDQLCQDKIDAKNDEIAQLRQEVLFARGQASQIQQNEQIVNSIYNRLDTCPVGTTPVYGRTPIFTCNNNGCGCGSF